MTRGKHPTFTEFVTSFWQRIAKAGSDECWLWMGSTKGRAPMKYGSCWFDGRNELAHRISWLLANGGIPDVPDADSRGACILHSCDTPLCCNPAHLFVGSHQKNMADKKAKGRDVGNKPFCKRGHPRTPENLYTSKQGLRACRICHKLRERERRTVGNKEQRTSSF